MRKIPESRPAPQTIWLSPEVRRSAKVYRHKYKPWEKYVLLETPWWWYECREDAAAIRFPALRGKYRSTKHITWGLAQGWYKVDIRDHFDGNQGPMLVHKLTTMDKLPKELRRVI